MRSAWRIDGELVEADKEPGQESDGWTASVARCENKVGQLRVAVNDFGNKCNERLSLIRWVLIGTVILLLIVLIR